MLFNGVYYNVTDKQGFPAQSLAQGNLVKPAGPSFNSKDIQLTANYILTDGGGGVAGILNCAPSDGWQCTAENSKTDLYLRGAGVQ